MEKWDPCQKQWQISAKSTEHEMKLKKKTTISCLPKNDLHNKWLKQTVVESCPHLWHGRLRGEATCGTIRRPTWNQLIPVEKFCLSHWTESLLLCKRDPAGTGFWQEQPLQAPNRAPDGFGKHETETLHCRGTISNSCSHFLLTLLRLPYLWICIVSVSNPDESWGQNNTFTAI